MKILTLKDKITDKYYKIKAENTLTKIGGFILHQKKNGEYRSCELIKVKEVKKVNKIPYFELKVVKVKREKKCKHCRVILSLEKNVYCYDCKKILKTNVTWDEFNGDTFIKDLKNKKGNWVNGENLDKIKFPCYCSYLDSSNKRCYGELKRNMYDIEIIQLKQDGTNLHFSNMTLKDLIEGLDIHILKGKLILFEEMMKN